MTLKLEKHPAFSGRNGPLLLIVMDGVGLAPDHAGNAVTQANTPVLDHLLLSPLATQLKTHGMAVGLPSDADMGNSEVGHNALGAGRVIPQGASLINQAIETGNLFTSPSWKEVERCGLAGGTVHFLGLISDGNVHSNIRHLFSLLNRCKSLGIKRVRVHTLLDGRDVSPRSALDYLEKLKQALRNGNAHGMDYRIASGGGRQIITMDRYDANLDMVKKGYECHVHGKVDDAANYVRNATDVVERYYAANPDGTDQDIPPFVVVDEAGEPIGRMQDGDAVVLFNFRGDRAMEISRALEQKEFNEFDRGPLPNFFFCSIIEYDGDLHIPNKFLVAPPVIDHTMVEYLCAEQLRTFAVSETQKFGHVTYFWNGNRSGYLCEALEKYDEVESDRVPFNQKPRMKADEITERTILRLNEPGMRFGRINFPNGDMVGHTGDFEATVKAMETVDASVGRLIDEVHKLGGIALVTADHGNAEEVFTLVDGEKRIRTSHTLNPVPFVIVDSNHQGEYQLRHDLETPGLVNVASTVFNLLGYHSPEGYAPSLIELRS